MKKLKILVMGITLFFISLLSLDAASFGMSSNTKQVAPNGTFTISVGGDCIGRVDLTVTNGTLSTNSVWVEEGYVSVRVTAGGSGTVTVTATPTAGFSDSDANIYNPGSRTVSVNISSNTSSNSSSSQNTTVSKKSGDNNLSTLTLNNGELSPSFNKDTLEYKVDLKRDITKLKIDATPSDPKAKIEGIGEIDVKPGNNNIEIKVTAENGNIKIYKINAYVDETPQVYLDYNKNKIGIVRNLEGLNIPEGFNKEDYKINDHNISIFTTDHITLIYGQNENDKSFYLFDKEKNEIVNKLTFLNINNRIIYIIDSESQRKNTTLDKIKINDIETNCYKFKNGNNNYCLLNGINKEGNKVEYLYESSENTIQLFPEFLIQETKDYTNIIIIACILLMLIPISIIIYIVIKSKKDKKEIKSKPKKRGNKNEKTK